MRIPSESLSHLTAVGLSHAPVAIAFLSAPPSDLPRVSSAQPAGCSYWKRASDGQAFYTTAEDHGNCAVGAYTHGVALSPAQQQELQSLVGTMIELKYLRSDEVAGIPHRSSPLQVAAYAPLGQASFEPDLVVFRGNARQIMLLTEAARAAGAFAEASVMGRPACAMLPAALGASSSVASVGCIGNRVYTELGDDELYLTVAGRALGPVLEKLGEIVAANVALEQFHRQREAALRA
jgi:uncharacterized protein (DUF169 family)